MTWLPNILSRGDDRPDGLSLFNCLSVDLEVSPGDQRIHALAGIRSDTDAVVNGRHGSLDQSLARLDELAAGADFIIGHHLIRFDLPRLQALNQPLRMLELPAVDTLMLNPLAFPQNPYHHLVKHYQDGQLRRGRINDPELDARLTLEVFEDQLRAFENRDRDLMTAWHWLATADGGEGFDMVFSSMRNAGRPGDRAARQTISSRLDGVACLKGAREVVNDAARHGWSLAYVLAWLSVAGGNSVMPPWVRHEFPETGRLLRLLRDTPCHDSGCAWCREMHDPRKELTRWFGFDEYRPDPAGEDGRSLQQSVVEAMMQDQSALAILPTGAGKSICYQVPALSRFDKTGALTVVISPLVALMSDQVASLERRGVFSAVTVNGLLSMPERGDALDRVRLGDASMLIISPEQLRSVSVRDVLAQRQIGYWVLDEAHCLSRWGHDFRPDYRYIGRFIRERSEPSSVPTVLCLTATAKPDVAAEIVDYFSEQLDLNLRVFDGGSHRPNLEFVVVKTSEGEKFDHTHQVISADLPPDGEGGAIVYCSTRRRTQEMAEFLQEKGLSAGHYHGGLSPEVKKDVQDGFIGGDIRVIVATNAFGMGIDKPDVRLVIHADIPGSLENYLQEAGRAGRDRANARCVLLYTPEDMDRQFGLSAMSRLSRREIQGVLKALRNIDRKNRAGGEVVATPGEILREDDGMDWERDSATDDTRVKTAVSWLEDAVLVTREENHVRVFPSSLRVSTIQEAEARLGPDRVNATYRAKLISIVRTLLESDADQGVSTDQLMMASGLSPEGVRKALYDLEEAGIATNDTVLTAFVHWGVQRSSEARFTEASSLETALIDLLRELDPDMGIGDSSQLHLRRTTQRLKDEGHPQALPERVRRIINSVAADGRGEGGTGGSLSVRGRDADSLQVTLRREWGTLSRMAEIRRDAASVLLQHLLSKRPEGSRGVDLLAETTMSQILDAIRCAPTLSRVHSPDRLAERAFLWLHEQEVIRLNRGLAVFRPAMTIRLAEGRRPFAESDFAPLSVHYDEQTIQVHIMDTYAQTGLDSMADALHLAMDYFVLGQKDFLDRWLPVRQSELTRQTTAESWRRIVDSLRNPHQRRIVVDNSESPNVLVLAGPGSGKTTVLVHRIAYLVRVRRQNPRSILALAYNRHAAVEIRRRLADLIGDEARGVIVLTCHALAMRLTGASFTGRANQLNAPDYQGVLKQATSLLRGDGLLPEEADEFRERLLAGFRWILCDEFQDMDQHQYALISALAGRTLADPESKLSLFAVGDDDQNIYSFSGASVEFVRRFESDYQAKSVLLTENYRSSKHIIAAANAVIEPARERMKAASPIEINSRRTRDPEGGEWTLLDPIGRGRVQILPAGSTSATQAQAVLAELKRLAQLDSEWDWASCAVVARDWSLLEPMRALCEMEDIPVQMANEEFSGIWFVRETRSLRDWLETRQPRVVSSAAIADHLAGLQPGPWVEVLQEGLSEYTEETGGAENPVDHFIEWLAEWGQDTRRRQKGLLLLSAHRVKGLEFDHVVVMDGNWDRTSKNEDRDAPRRLYYVAMTRARKTLTLARMPGPHPLQSAIEDSPDVLVRADLVHLPPPAAGLSDIYRNLSLRDVFLSYAGYRSSGDPVHEAIAALRPGDHLEMRVGTHGRWELLNGGQQVIGQLASSYKIPDGLRVKSASVMAVVVWEKANSTPEYQESLRCDRWEVVIPALVLEPVR